MTLKLPDLFSDSYLDVLYEDTALMVVNKPSGMITHSFPGNKQVTLADILQQYGPSWSMLDPSRPGIVHRLDKHTEGLMMVAKTSEVHLALKDQFKNRQIEKRYYAVAKGDISDDEGVIDVAIAKHPSHYQKRITVPDSHDGAKDATTTFKVLRRFSSKTLVDVSPKTGRTHQIRLHLAHIGHPLIGDDLYLHHKKRPSKSRAGHLLQAYFLRFFHPVKGLDLSFKLPLSSRLA